MSRLVPINIYCSTIMNFNDFLNYNLKPHVTNSDNVIVYSI